jgi:hypothetical protein
LRAGGGLAADDRYDRFGAVYHNFFWGIYQGKVVEIGTQPVILSWPGAGVIPGGKVSERRMGEAA